MKDASYQTEDKHNSTGSASIASKGDSVQEKKSENISSLKTIGDSPEKIYEKSQDPKRAETNSQDTRRNFLLTQANLITKQL